MPNSNKKKSCFTNVIHQFNFQSYDYEESSKKLQEKLNESTSAKTKYYYYFYTSKKIHYIIKDNGERISIFTSETCQWINLRNSPSLSDIIIPKLSSLKKIEEKDEKELESKLLSQKIQHHLPVKLTTLASIVPILFMIINYLYLKQEYTLLGIPTKFIELPSIYSICSYLWILLYSIIWILLMVLISTILSSNENMGKIFLIDAVSSIIPGSYIMGLLYWYVYYSNTVSTRSFPTFLLEKVLIYVNYLKHLNYLKCLNHLIHLNYLKHLIYKFIINSTNFKIFCLCCALSFIIIYIIQDMTKSFIEFITTNHSLKLYTIICIPLLIVVMLYVPSTVDSFIDSKLCPDSSAYYSISVLTRVDSSKNNGVIIGNYDKKAIIMQSNNNLIDVNKGFQITDIPSEPLKRITVHIKKTEN